MALIFRSHHSTSRVHLSRPCQTNWGGLIVPWYVEGILDSQSLGVPNHGATGGVVGYRAPSPHFVA